MFLGGSRDVVEVSMGAPPPPTPGALGPISSAEASSGGLHSLSPHPPAPALSANGFFSLYREIY